MFFCPEKFYRIFNFFRLDKTLFHCFSFCKLINACVFQKFISQQNPFENRNYPNFNFKNPQSQMIAEPKTTALQLELVGQEERNQKPSPTVRPPR
jgi:hypothetical protein